MLLLQEIFGVSDYIKQRAADLAALGSTSSRRRSTGGWTTPSWTSRRRICWRGDGDHGPARLGSGVSDSVAALEYLRSRDAGTGVVGFCFGGGLGFNVAAGVLDHVLVSYYGSALPQLLELEPKVTRPACITSATPTRICPRVDDIVAVLGDAEVHLYPGAGHAFDNPLPAFHHAEASELAWRRTVAFLARQLPTSQGSA